jgi:hypothetical protein
VTGGKVELAVAVGPPMVVAAGTSASFAVGRVGTPVAPTAAPALRAALADLDDGRFDALPAALAAAGDGDLVTLANLLSGCRRRDDRRWRRAWPSSCRCRSGCSASICPRPIRSRPRRGAPTRWRCGWSGAPRSYGAVTYLLRQAFCSDGKLSCWVQ